MRVTLMIHGGAGAGGPDLDRAQRPGCFSALKAGWDVLLAGGSAVDAVVASVAVLEDDPGFNAGVGSVLTSAGGVEMDASIMDGSDLRAGAVALLRETRNPVRLARALLVDGRHVFMAGPAADEYARQHGVPTCAPEDFVTPQQRQRWQDAASGAGGTVGAVAVDRNGHTAAATSTGGMDGKQPGRIGDSAVIGAGTYADDRLGAGSATGTGEEIIRLNLVCAVLGSMRHGGDPANAVPRVVPLLRSVGGTGGMIAVDRFGRFAYAHNTPHMSVGWMRTDLDAPVVVL
ncbi:MAG: isoaspartyl peptidase/L-asparaginase [Deltaproteobacteria bacterium]|nr:isoaspartyl peptidase/L-asparaginase [Deltaproteobacteria bacterium]